MPLSLELLAAAHTPAAEAFNARLDAAGMPAGFRIGTSPPSGEAGATAALRMESYVALDDGHVRGGVMLQHQPFVIGGVVRPTVNLQLPISEGWIDKQYAAVGMWIIKTVLQRHPLAFAVGMGGLDQPLPKLLGAMGWLVQPIPFFFRVHRPSRFLRMLPELQRGIGRRIAAHAAAWTGAGALGLAAARARAGWPRIAAPRIAAEPVSGWGEWADDVWHAHPDRASMIGVRDRATLALLYPRVDRQQVYRLRDAGRDVGWIAVLRTQMRSNGHFGDLVVGTLLDAVVLAGYELAAVRAASDVLAGLGADVSVVNHAHIRWQAALRAGGFLPQRSNYLLATSRQLTAAVGAAGDPQVTRAHVTRGDGDGRIHL